jgi:hypothetical protein
MKWLDMVNAWTWAHISDVEFLAAAEQLGALHVHAARTLIQKDFEENWTIKKFCSFGNESNRN